MAEWLRRGLQILAPEFDSRSGLHRDFVPIHVTGADKRRLHAFVAIPVLVNLFSCLRCAESRGAADAEPN